jgi:hypothetical protein
LASCAAVVVAAALPACDSSAPPPPMHRPFSEVPTLDGVLLSPLHLTTIVPANDAGDAPALFDFSSALRTTRWWRTVAGEYHLGDIAATHELMGPPITADITDHEIYEYIHALVDANASLAPDGNSLYLLYLPRGIQVISEGKANTDCNTFGAYHTSYEFRGDNWAVVQRCTEVAAVENMTVSASHEIVEAATDPGGRGYRLPEVAAEMPWTETIWNAFDRTGGTELADLCEGTFWVEGEHVFQRIWSNAAARGGRDPCIPALGEPFYDSDVDQDWYPVAAGDSVTIALKGWATGRVGAWPVKVLIDGGAVAFTATLHPSGQTLEPGATLALAVTAPADAPSGSWAIATIINERPSSPPNLTDGAHVAYVGVYVP